MSFSEYSDIVLGFVRDHKQWAAPIVFALAFGKSLAFVSLVLPFWIMLVGIGTIIGASDSLNYWSVLLAAGTGAALGDWLSYWLGYYFHDRLEKMWPLSKYPDLMPRGHAFFERFGVWAIVIGRFLGPLRASVPIVAGITQMPSWKFQIANWTSAYLWAFVLLSPGTFGLKWLLGHH